MGTHKSTRPPAWPAFVATVNASLDTAARGKRILLDMVGVVSHVLEARPRWQGRP